MKPFEGLLNKIKGLGSKTELKKSDMPDGGSNPPPADGGANIDDITTKVVAAFTDGSLEPTAEAVTAYLVANGTPEAEAGDMADMILDSYFESTGTPEGEGGEAPTGEPDGDEAMKSEFAKLVHAVQKSTFGTEVLSQGMTKLFEKFEALQSKVEAITKDNQIMKSALRVAAGKPVKGATPVLKAELATAKSDIPLVRKREMVLEAIQKSELSAVELSYVNKHMEFSDSAKDYFIKKGVQI